ncbi:hypothetical protein J1N35_020151 [Gossypium stocksii]|uniref:Uncharacterized protein n=1 Tax=Gossypium stocksii TaxID=47602 RepID=A0A9D3VBW7_9ROSI|nr:hypothetical protein J1N35_020151 [Gossypium stocksii]
MKSLVNCRNTRVLQIVPLGYRQSTSFSSWQAPRHLLIFRLNRKRVATSIVTLTDPTLHVDSQNWEELRMQVRQRHLLRLKRGNLRYSSGIKGLSLKGML